MKKIILLLILVAGICSNIPADRYVVFNTQTKKYHEFSCASIKRCTKNCVTIKESDALKLGGIHCRKCIRKQPVEYQ